MWMTGDVMQKRQTTHKHTPQELSDRSPGPMEENILQGSSTNKSPQAEIAEDAVGAGQNRSICPRGGRPVRTGTKVRMTSTRCDGGDEY